MIEINFEYMCSQAAESLPMLAYVIRKGNTTVYEWRTGSVPRTIERPKQAAHVFDDDEEKDSAVEDKIDFGDLDVPATLADTANDVSQDQVNIFVVFN